MAEKISVLVLHGYVVDILVLRRCNLMLLATRKMDAYSVNM